MLVAATARDQCSSEKRGSHPVNRECTHAFNVRARHLFGNVAGGALGCMKEIHAV
jgi:hypothetical protein